MSQFLYLCITILYFFVNISSHSLIGKMSITWHTVKLLHRSVVWTVNSVKKYYMYMKCSVFKICFISVEEACFAKQRVHNSWIKKIKVLAKQNLVDSNVNINTVLEFNAQVYLHKYHNQVFRVCHYFCGLAKLSWYSLQNLYHAQ